MLKGTYLIYKKSKPRYLQSKERVKTEYDAFGSNQKISVGPVLEGDMLIGSADTEEQCEIFINTLDAQGTFYWIKGIVKNTSVEP